jgi:predicted lipid-binding transport protein (Tim44 family)
MTGPVHNIANKSETKEENMFSRGWIKFGLMIFSLFFFLTFVLELDAYARAGGGRSSGSSGSRSYSSPQSPSATPSSPSRQVGPAPSAPLASPQSGGFLRSMAGGLVGGMIGGMLFRSMGFGGGGGIGGGGIGLFEIILIGAILYGIWWYIKKKRREAEAPAGPAYYREASVPELQQPAYAPSYGQQAAASDIDAGLGYIRHMDPAFDEQKFKDQCLDNFFKVQGAWANRDMSPIRSMLTDEMYRILQGDADELKQKKRINRLENIAVRTVESAEVWQESGKDFITARFYANLLDYTTDEMTGEVVSGSKTEPVKFEEFWTFTRPVGNNPWQLSAINQVS